MRISDVTTSFRFSIILCLGFGVLAIAPLLSRAQSSTSASVVNNSSRAIRNVYSSHVDADDWSNNLLNGATIAAGQTFTIDNIACDQQQYKLIAEDQDGCFSSVIGNRGEGFTWTINNETPRDCGSY